MKIFIGSDHAGFELKNQIVEFLKSEGHEVEDKGSHKYEKNDDYPDFVIPAAQAVANNPDSKGIVLGMSGQGEAMAANKVKGIRAALYYGGEKEIITLSREHNNANVLSLGAKFLSIDELKEAIRLWLKTPFSEKERHIRRVNKISEFENE